MSGELEDGYFAIEAGVYLEDDKDELLGGHQQVTLSIMVSFDIIMLKRGGDIKMQYYAKRKRVVLIVLIAVLLFSFIACKNAIPNEDNAILNEEGSELMQHVYDDPLFGSFSIEFPKGWNMTEMKAKAENSEQQESLFSMFTLQLRRTAEADCVTFRAEDCIVFQMDRTWMFYETVVEEKGTYTKSRTELTDDNKQVDVYVDSSTLSENIYLIYLYGKDDTTYYYGEVKVSKSVYDANKDTIEHVMKSFKIN